MSQLGQICATMNTLIDLRSSIKESGLDVCLVNSSRAQLNGISKSSDQFCNSICVYLVVNG
jgi:hypothetical protein